MKPNLLIVLNPTAGSIDVTKVECEARDMAELHNYEVFIHKTTGHKDFEKLEEKLATKRFNRVVVAGGDGTINLVASVVINSDITLGILSCGSANGLATSLGFPENFDQQLKIAITYDAESIDTLTVNDTICLHIADIGINAELIYNYETANGSGMIGYAKQCLPTLFKSDYPYKFIIDIENNIVKCKGILLAFANAKKYGTGAIINPIGKINDGFFEVILYKRLNFLDIIKAFLNRTSKKETTIDMYSTKSVSVESKNEIALQVDGEFIGKFKKFDAYINSKNLKMALPKSKKD